MAGAIPSPAPLLIQRVSILGASSDHLIVDPGKASALVGTEIRFEVNYSALARAMTSPFVAKTTATIVPARARTISR